MGSNTAHNISNYYKLEPGLSFSSTKRHPKRFISKLDVTNEHIRNWSCSWVGCASVDLVIYSVFRVRRERSAFYLFQSLEDNPLKKGT